MSMMPPQQQDSLADYLLKRRSSGECSVDRHDDDVSTASTATTASPGDADWHCRVAEEWLYRGGVSSSRTSPLVPSEEAAAAEAWLCRRGVSTNPLRPSSIPVVSSAALRCSERRNSPDRTDSPSSSEVLSSRSCPETTGSLEHLQSRLLQEEGGEPLHANATCMAFRKAPPPQRDEPLHTLPMWMDITNPPPPPATPHPTPVTPTGKSNANSCHVKGNSRDCYDQAIKMDTFDEAAKNDRCDDKIIKKEPIEKKPDTTTTNAVAKIMEALQENDKQCKAAKAAAHASLLRLSRQVQFGTRDQVLPKKTNVIMLHIYDLLPTETIMQLGWGCEFPIGQCFNAMNDRLYELGTGAYHCGIEINGIEYAYGSNSTEGITGVFSCVPKHSPGFEYRTSLDFGSRPLTRTAWVRVGASNESQSVYREIITYVDGRDVMKEMAKEYLGADYDLLRRNCCTFARDACVRLGIRKDEIPSWFMNLADAGAATQDAAYMTFSPIASMLSHQDNCDGDGSFFETGTEESQTGFEVIAKRKEGQQTAMEIVKVVDALEMEPPTTNGKGEMGVRRALSWTY